MDLICFYTKNYKSMFNTFKNSLKDDNINIKPLILDYRVNGLCKNIYLVKTK